MENQIIKGDEIDLLALVKTIWQGRKIILYSVVVCFIIGLVISFSGEKKYQASATILPSAENKSSGLGGLSSLAGLAGVNIGSMMGQSASGIPADLYPKVVASVPYLMELMHEPFRWEKYPQPMSVYELMEIKSSSSSKESVLMKYTLRLPWTIKDAILGSPKEQLSVVSGRDSVGYLVLSPIHRSAIQYLKSAMVVEQDKKNDLVTLQVEVNDPLLAAQIADKAVGLLQKYVIDYKSKQAKEQLMFIEKRYAEVKDEYEKNRNRLMDYRDSHRNLISERTDVQYQRLSDDYDMSSSVFKGLAQQLEQAKITVKEETPVFTVLEPVVVPKDKSAPKRGMIMAVSVFLGGFFGLIGILINHLIPSIKRIF
ncbi:putative tyrosine kinase-like protein [Breznakibacter xylanolyticus]|uniref:Putative tyrosine kinase-like protein n=1 Tax=Breznakibacter xylanolyticus TaxID=990 RepID=A0A2W7NRD6_9BACT|nr:Wzz/FepE/Etk N-terminal domain-containing protein [Breznakibacter xylanolyticus]PZX19174.1 putative tyrosine kinase-like protein [Breznakibacter xylanolyticus]